MKAQIEACCPEDVPFEPICCYEPCDPYGGIRRGDGYSAKSRARAEPVQVSDRHPPWKIRAAPMHEDDDVLPQVPQGPLVGLLVPAPPTPHVLDFRSGPGPAPDGGTQEPVSFRTFTSSGVSTSTWPPDMSGAKAGDVVLMSGNLWLKLKTDWARPSRMSPSTASSRPTLPTAAGPATR